MRNCTFIAILLGILILCSPLFSDASDEPTVEIVVSARATLIGICNEYLEYPKKWREIAKINQIKNPDLIYPGQVLHIPASDQEMIH